MRVDIEALAVRVDDLKQRIEALELAVSADDMQHRIAALEERNKRVKRLTTLSP